MPANADENLIKKEAAEGITRDAEGVFTYKKGVWWPATILLVLPFMLIIKPMYEAVKKKMNWKAMLATIAIFEVVMLLSEHYAIRCGLWVWNESRILGPKIGNIPIEEPFLYYWFGPFLTIVIMLFVEKKLTKKPKPVRAR